MAPAAMKLRFGTDKQMKARYQASSHESFGQTCHVNRLVLVAPTEWLMRSERAVSHSDIRAGRPHKPQDCHRAKDESY
eukprot:1352300-Amphidinium_carterae.1